MDPPVKPAGDTEWLVGPKSIPLDRGGHAVFPAEAMR